MVETAIDLDERKKWARKVARQLTKMYPDAHCTLDFDSPLQLVVATVLAAQCTDARVNKVTPALFAKYPTAQDYADANLSELEKMVQSTGFFRNKAKNIKAMGQALVDHYQGQVPDTMQELLTLPGVARKTANVVLGNAFDKPGLPVDTHVGRLSRRMNLTTSNNPQIIERELCELLPKKQWAMFSHRMIFHGRDVCTSRKAKCSDCLLNRDCPQVGVES